MNRLLAALVVGLLAASVAVADIPPPPPPKGKKYVSVDNEVVLGKDVNGYVFVQQVGRGPGAPKYTYEKVELKPGKAKAMASAGRYTYVTLVAVPQDAAKEFKTDAELIDALKANKLKGVHRFNLPGSATVPDEVPGKSVRWTHTITAIDAKEGIKRKVEGAGYEQPKGGTKSAPKPGAAPPARAPLVAGAALFAAITLGGLWLAGRSRRKV